MVMLLLNGSYAALTAILHQEYPCHSVCSRILWSYSEEGLVKTYRCTSVATPCQRLSHELIRILTEADELT